MNQRLDRLTQLWEIKKDLTNTAYQQLLHAQEQFSKNKEKHDQLVGYRQDYLQQLETMGEQGTYVRRLRNRIDFISHLDMALVQLNGHLAQLAKVRRNAESTYKQAKISEESVNLLIERVKKAQKSKLNLQEQKENDEYAQKQWYSRELNDE
ncbi:flagellar export protein FliJ [Legionella rowbothamii]|uniref:flagellar export protein FliJ n=1 Tax=Legionella rowbothamii TaxID=96229 RepID=UPI001054463C|nr:flagellar export protein FliJ [Legionella rowbothamii]